MGDFAADEVTLVFHLIPSRRRARVVAEAEAGALLEPFGAAALVGGPIAERGGVFWMTLPREACDLAALSLCRLGYVAGVDLAELHVTGTRAPRGTELVRWRHRHWRLRPLYRADPLALREMAPDRRTFVLNTVDGLRNVRGYRGDGRAGSCRALPVADARMLVNLGGRPDGLLLDPFAGAGGVVVEALASGWRVVSADHDPALQDGLRALGAHHHVADSASLPLAAASVVAVATEPPYHPGSGALLAATIREVARVLVPGGRSAWLAAPWQRGLLREGAARLGWEVRLDSPVDRKGTAVVAFAARVPLR